MELEQAIAILSETKRNILIAEDSESNVMLAQLYLSKTACVLDVAQDGQEAVDRFRDKNYALVLMDIRMPVMDGYEATRRIREIERERGSVPVPIVAVTANPHDDERKRCSQAGCTAFLPKPISKAGLLGCIAELISRS